MCHNKTKDVFMWPLMVIIFPFGTLRQDKEVPKKEKRHEDVILPPVRQWRIQDFPLGGGAEPLGGRQLSMQALFGENVCENERNGSRWGGGRAPAAPPLDPPM